MYAHTPNIDCGGRVLEHERWQRALESVRAAEAWGSMESTSLALDNLIDAFKFFPIFLLIVSSMLRLPASTRVPSSPHCCPVGAPCL